MRIRLRFLALATMAGLLASVGLPPSSRADCQPVASIADALATAEVAFVGTVVAVTDSGSRAAIGVEELWGPELADLRPEGVASAQPGGESAAQWMPILALLAGSLGVAGLFLIRQRRTARGSG